MRANLPELCEQREQAAQPTIQAIWGFPYRPGQGLFKDLFNERVVALYFLFFQIR